VLQCGFREVAQECCTVVQCVVVHCSVLQRVAACGSVLQHVAACCSVVLRGAAQEWVLSKIGWQFAKVSALLI